MIIEKSHIVGPEDIPSGKIGNIEIKNYILEEDIYPGGWKSSDRMRQGERFVGLYSSSGVWMSNTPAEERSCRIRHLEKTDRNILIGGLGIGFVIKQIQEYFEYLGEDPEKITVVEINKDIIDLVGPTYTNNLPWLEIINDDIFEYGKNAKLIRKKYYDKAYIDVWGCISTDDLEAMTKVKKSLRPVMKPGSGRVKCWNEEFLKSQKKSNGRYRRMW